MVLGDSDSGDDGCGLGPDPADCEFPFLDCDRALDFDFGVYHSLWLSMVRSSPRQVRDNCCIPADTTSFSTVYDLRPFELLTAVRKGLGSRVQEAIEGMVTSGMIERPSLQNEYELENQDCIEICRSRAANICISVITKWR